MPSKDPQVKKSAYARWWAKRKGTPEEQAYQQRQYEKHRERYLAKSRAQYAEARLDPEYMRRASERAKKWAKENALLHNITNHLRRQQQRIGDVAVEQVVALLAEYDSRCAYCGDHWKHIDHVVPLARGGQHTITNLVPACARCNLSKGAKSVKEWLSL